MGFSRLHKNPIKQPSISRQKKATFSFFSFLGQKGRTLNNKQSKKLQEINSGHPDICCFKGFI